MTYDEYCKSHYQFAIEAYRKNKRNMMLAMANPNMMAMNPMMTIPPMGGGYYPNMMGIPMMHMGMGPMGMGPMGMGPMGMAMNMGASMNPYNMNSSGNSNTNR